MYRIRRESFSLGFNSGGIQQWGASNFHLCVIRFTVCSNHWIWATGRLCNGNWRRFGWFQTGRYDAALTCQFATSTRVADGDKQRRIGRGCFQWSSRQRAGKSKSSRLPRPFSRRFIPRWIWPFGHGEYLGKKRMKRLMQSMKQNRDKILGFTIFGISLSLPSLVETRDRWTTNCKRKGTALKFREWFQVSFKQLS